MKVTKVCCQGCGADLQIDESIRFVTCNYCNARLEVVHEDTVTHTKRLDKIEQTTDQIGKRVKVIELQNHVEQLDREWEKFRQSVSTKSENGEIMEPKTGMAIANGIIGFLAGIAFIAVGFAGPQPLIGICIGIFAIGVSFYIMRHGHWKAEHFQLQKYRYETARKGLLQQLDQAMKA
ncbi:MAG: hypothetical protein ABIS50_21920 [Luteolibacter sp.]|uniref:hypothetical protein n=1 Tax=Luteolibacter sp. TaxID=1962973 RepID=UPI0032673B23